MHRSTSAMAPRKGRCFLYGHYEIVKNWKPQIFMLILLFRHTGSSSRKYKLDRSGRISFATLELITFVQKYKSLMKIRAYSCAAAWRKVVKSSLKLLLGSRWDVRQHHWGGSGRKPRSVPAQQSYEWGFRLHHKLDAAVWQFQLQQGNQGKVLWQESIFN